MDILISVILFNNLKKSILMDNHSKHIVPYKTYLIILASLIVLTILSILITEIELGEYSTAGALIFASVKTFLVLSYFMHLKFDNLILKIFVGLVIAVFVAVVVITFMDYIHR
ncbi:hypothetical protein EYV94_22395 [Puteibacter caeruleilacunae]|nr:hypothetical protein EYV94_22395 [Puteibacter caeruleilacunae]